MRTEWRAGRSRDDVTVTVPSLASNSGARGKSETLKAGTVYANPTSQGGTSSGNTHVVSQYDVACYQQSVKPSSGKSKP